MAELLVFPGRSRLFTVQVADDLFDQLDPAYTRGALVDGLRVRYVAARDLVDEPSVDLAVAPYAPAAPDRQMLFDTLSGERYEQDAQGMVLRDGEPLWDEPPVAFGVPRSCRYNRLTLGSEASLLFLSRRASGWACSVQVTAPLLLVLREPRTRPAAVVPTLWLDLANRALDGGNWDEAEDDGA